MGLYSYKYHLTLLTAFLVVGYISSSPSNGIIIESVSCFAKEWLRRIGTKEKSWHLQNSTSSPHAHRVGVAGVSSDPHRTQTGLGFRPEWRSGWKNKRKYWWSIFRLQPNRQIIKLGDPERCQNLLDYIWLD